MIALIAATTVTTPRRTQAQPHAEPDRTSRALADALEADSRTAVRGNVREPENLVGRADVIGPGDLPLGLREPIPAGGGAQARAAEALGISERGLCYELRRYGLSA